STIEFDSLQHEVRELECESDPIIRIVDVHAGELEGWDLIPTGPNTPAHVRVRFREPVRKGTLRIYGICPLNGRNAEIWTSPELRLLNAIPREENLVLHVHSDVQFTDWRPGRYRQVKTVVEGDGTRVLSLIRGSLDSGLSADSARPRARVTTTSVEYQARQILWWQVQSRKSSLTCQLNYEALRGRLFQLPLELPAGWRVERVELTPSGLLRDWEIGQERGIATLFVNLQRPLQRRTKNGGAQNRTGRLTVRLTAEGPALDWAFPDIIPRGAR